ncbi:MAG: EexN family lipoprotein [Gammaproteobacteria bacterium]
MPIQYFGAHFSAGAGRLGLLGILAAACFLAGCAEAPRARSYMEFMEDSYAREGALARCNRDREATAEDPECVNARRAASMIAAQADAERRDQREAESEALLVAARERSEREQHALEQAQAAAQAQADAQYESQWSGSTEVLGSDPVAPVIEDDSTPVIEDDGTYNSLASTLGVVGPPRPVGPPQPAAAPVAPATTSAPAPRLPGPAPASVPAPSPDLSSNIASVAAPTPTPSMAAPTETAPAMPVEVTPQVDQAMPLLDHVEIPSEAAPELLYVELPPGPQAANGSTAQPLQDISLPEAR